MLRQGQLNQTALKKPSKCLKTETQFLVNRPGYHLHTRDQYKYQISLLFMKNQLNTNLPYKCFFQIDDLRKQLQKIQDNLPPGGFTPGPELIRPQLQLMNLQRIDIIIKKKCEFQQNGHRTSGAGSWLITIGEKQTKPTYWPPIGTHNRHLERIYQKKPSKGPGIKKSIGPVSDY